MHEVHVQQLEVGQRLYVPSCLLGCLAPSSDIWTMHMCSAAIYSDQYHAGQDPLMQSVVVVVVVAKAESHIRAKAG
jgi:hypothetical protein